MQSSKKIIFIIFSIVVLYAIWNGRNLILGPQINVIFPPPNYEPTGNLIIVKGVAKNVSFMTLDGRQIYTDKDGNFAEDLLLLPGLNTIDIEARDRFGKTTSKIFQIYNRQKENFVENASSTNKESNN